MLSNRISGQNFECIPLKWDSDYFGISCGRVALSGEINEREQSDICRFCRDFNFVTIANLHNNKANNLWLGTATKAFLADINIQFIKQIVAGSATMDSRITITNKYEGSHNLLDIAAESFSFSRFFNDPKLPTEQAKNIYKHWTGEAFNREDKYFTLYFKDKQPVAYVLFILNKEENYGCIELIAVDKGRLGQGIGKALIHATESYLAEQGILSLRVGTQADNQAAIAFYVSCGFKYSYVSTVYHLWN